MSNKLAVTDSQETELTSVSSPGNMIFQPGMLERVEHLAEIMAKSRSMVPAHLRGNASDCMAIVMQSAQWRMDPFAVAQKTYQIQAGAPIGYEAQLVNAVIIQNGPFTSRPRYKFFGNWEKVQGRLTIKTSSKGKKFAVPAWSDADEEGIGVTVTVQVKGEDEPTAMDVLLKQCWPRNSTNWANDPQQQLCYAAIRKMVRRHFPDVIMGIYTPDEIQYEQPAERDITPDSHVSDLLPDNTDADTGLRLAEAIGKISKAETMDELMAVGKEIVGASENVQDKCRPAYQAKQRELQAKDAVNTDTGEIAEGGPTLEEITAMIESSSTSEALDAACDAISLLPKQDQHAAVKAATAQRTELDS